MLPGLIFSFKNLITRYISIYLHCCGLDLREEFQTNGKHLKAFVIKGVGVSPVVELFQNIVF